MYYTTTTTASISMFILRDPNNYNTVNTLKWCKHDLCQE